MRGGAGGSRLAELAAGLARLAATRTALAAGEIDWPRAMVVADELSVLEDADARAAEALVLPHARGLTTGALRAALRRAVLSIDPAAAGRRRRAARQDAGVHLWQEASGNSALAGRELPPAEAIAADHQLAAQARRLKAHGAEARSTSYAWRCSAPCSAAVQWKTCCYPPLAMARPGQVSRPANRRMAQRSPASPPQPRRAARTTPVPVATDGRR